MNKTIIKVPRGVRYINDWEGFSDIFPEEPHILDKTITGCGFTEWCIRNSSNLILCSPRNILLDNKTEQHPGEVYRVVSEAYDRDLGVDKDLAANPARLGIGSEEPEPGEEEERSAVEKIDQELGEYIRTLRPGAPIKILVTYDSFGLLKKVLKYRGQLDIFQVVVDEWQSIFIDARFKSSTEMRFVEELKELRRVCFLSATPMIDRYLEMMDDFKDLPYYELDWGALDPERVTKPNLTVRCIRSIYEEAKKVIEQYITGKSETRISRDSKTGQLVQIQSREAVMYMNSVNNICDTIKKSGLGPTEVNILCAKTTQNKKTIRRKLGTRFDIGRVPLEGESRKMFTFCTRTVYLGADFYSDNAKSYIFSDANIDSLSVDISLDLPQILGRQRLETNPWKNSAEFYYKPLRDKKKMTQEEFNKVIDEKMIETNNLIDAWKTAANTEVKESLNRKYKSDAKHSNYKNDYVAINDISGKPEINQLVVIAEQRAFDIQQVDYADRFTVVNALYSGGSLDMESTQGRLINEVNTVQFGLEGCRGTAAKLRYLCETGISDEARRIITGNLPGDIQSYLALGPERLKAVGYNTTKIKKEIGQGLFDEEVLKERIYQKFKEGDRLSKAEAKTKLREIYDEVDYKKTAKALDLEEWFELKRVQQRSGSKINELVELIKKKM